jgi:uncharacterized protein YecE (DUF72 family)
MNIKIGCTGWSYQGWVGPFYPKSMDDTNYLKHYSGAFDITEVNSTFYKIPTRMATQKWFTDTPDDFTFTAKLPQVITHENRLRPGPYLDRFLDSISPLQSKMKILVIQLPPSLSFDESKTNLEKMVNHLPKNYRYAVEGRHSSWFSDSSIQFLSRYNLCLVWNDVSGVPLHDIITTDLVYIRLIGDRTIPENQFGKIQKDRTSQIKSWVEKLTKIKDSISFAAILANNHYEGFSPQTANKLRLELGMKPVTWSDKTQTTLV